MNRSFAVAITTVTVGATLALGNAQAVQASTNPCPQIVSHATNEKAAPENSIQGINSVAATGAKWVELDVRNTKSHFAVLMHDPTIDRTTTGTGNVSDWGLTDITNKVSAADYAPWNTQSQYEGFNTDGTPKVKVPYGYDIFNAVSHDDLTVLVDYKVTPVEADADNLIQYADRFNWRSRIVIMGNAATLAAWQEWYPNLAYVFIEYPATGFTRTAQSLIASHASAYVIPAQYLADNSTLADYYHANNIQLWSWTSDTDVIDTPATRGIVHDAGIDRLITNYPANALAECPTTETTIVKNRSTSHS
jgi:glycerophosphoryl diester phosphodiesterase